MHEMNAILQELLSEERHLHRAYTAYLPLLHSAVLRKKIEGRVGEGWKHIEGLERAIEKRGAAPDQSTAPAAVPPSAETHALLDFFYQAEERLYYLYQEASKRAEEEWLRSLLFSHSQDQKRHLAEIQRLYTEFLYY